MYPIRTVILILTLLMSCTGLSASAGIDSTNEHHTDTETRCRMIVDLSDENFDQIRADGTLSSRLSELNLDKTLLKYNDTILREHLLNLVDLTLDSILTNDPRSSYAWLLKGNVNYKLNKKDIDKTTSYYLISEQYDSGRSSVINYNIGTVLLESGNNGKARVYLKKAYESAPNCFNCAYNNAVACYRMEDGDQAIYWCQKALHIYSDDAPCYYRMGLSYGKLKHNLDSAIICISKALTLKGTEAVYYEDLAVAYGMNRNYNKAVEVSLECLKKFPDYLPSLNNLAISLDKLGKKGLANRYRRKAKAVEAKDTGH